MPLYYLRDSLNVGGSHLKMFSIHGLYQLPPKSRQQLIDRNLIREIITVSAEHYEEFSEYAIMIQNAGYETLGDFAGANSDGLPDDLKPVQLQALEFLNPARPAGIPENDCCG